MSENLFNTTNKHNSGKYVKNWPNIFGEKKTRIFSYGTLMSGCSRHHIMKSLKGKKVLDVDIKDFRLYANTDHPTVRKEKGYSVIGEVWEFNLSSDEVLRSLDRIEGYPNYYGREEITVGNERAWVYIMTDEAFYQQLEAERIMPIESGNWRDPKGAR